jgi:chemotaxis protein methyltransferase CheR
MVKEWEASGQRRMRFWSAACSTGEEPYSMCITILEALGENYNARILATDISTRALAAAQHGAYEKDKIKQVPGILAERYFSMSSESDEVCYMAKPVLKNMVVFKRLNLSVPPFPMRGPLDIVFCRNVMIYFDNRVRHGLLSEIYRILKPQGYLMVGHSESLVGIIKGFKAVQPSIYMKKG